jgi:hypothetical protein
MGLWVGGGGGGLGVVGVLSCEAILLHSVVVLAVLLCFFGSVVGAVRGLTGAVNLPSLHLFHNRHCFLSEEICLDCHSYSTEGISNVFTTFVVSFVSICTCVSFGGWSNSRTMARC